MSETVKDILEEFGIEGEDANLTLRDLVDSYLDQRLLIDIGRNLNIERDPSRLLRMVLNVSRKITGADAGSIFLVEEEGRTLRFSYAYTHSLNVDYEEFTMPRSAASLAGYVSLEGKPLNIANAYDLPEGLPYCFNRSFDEANGYRTVSLLVVPMKNHMDEVIGVIQLINAKAFEGMPKGTRPEDIILRTREDYDNFVVPFQHRYNNLMVAVANQAAIAIENSRMIVQVRDTFDAFVEGAVTAVDSRDPDTSDHSRRVAALALELAKAVREKPLGPYGKVTFSELQLQELRYAGLLHDFGKVSIDPSVFGKPRKLYDHDLKKLLVRLRYLYRSVELGFVRREAEACERGESEERLRLAQERAGILSRLLAVEGLVLDLNEPQVTDRDPEPEIKGILETPLPDFARGIQDEPIPILEDSEIVNLAIKRGSLNPEERKLIQLHVKFTYDILAGIPWPPEYRRVPEFAALHHELLDGSGYPKGLKGAPLWSEGDPFPIQARILTICDIFDALTASRPYKKAMGSERALSILRDEAAAGKLDAELVSVFAEARVWERPGVSLGGESAA